VREAHDFGGALAGHDQQRPASGAHPQSATSPPIARRPSGDAKEPCRKATKLGRQGSSSNNRMLKVGLKDFTPQDRARWRLLRTYLVVKLVEQVAARTVTVSLTVLPDIAVPMLN